MQSGIEHLGLHLFKNIEATQKLWFQIFGLDFHRVWRQPDLMISEIIDFARNQLEDSSSLQRGTAHATLFMRDPLADRLILEYSTNRDLIDRVQTPSDRFFKNKSENYNNDRRECFYDLCDSLCDDSAKRSDSSREKRGLTGWIAVSGIPLLLNSSRSQEMIDDLIKENTLADQSCQKYGHPKWGHRISEFYTPIDQNTWSKRFIGVPITSIINKDKTIGVIRYACPVKSNELSKIDLLFLSNIASLISIIKNIKQISVLCNRDCEFEREKMKFNHYGDISEFLQFIAYSLRSEICSLYFKVDCKEDWVLRLFDAYGISEYTGDCRERIKDYSPNDTGLTYEIFTMPDLYPKTYESVVDSASWQGKNTKLFYSKALKHYSVHDINNCLDNPVQKRELISRHPIKLVGCSIHFNNEPIGVLKVEFPKIYDSSHHYDTSDHEFLKKCAILLKDYLIGFRDFINGKWFENADEGNVKEYIMYIGQIFRYKLIKHEECCDSFWKNAKKYAEDYTELIHAENLAAMTRGPSSNDTWFKNVKELSKIEDSDQKWGWLKKTFISETMKGVIKEACNIGGLAVTHYFSRP